MTANMPWPCLTANEHRVANGLFWWFSFLVGLILLEVQNDQGSTLEVCFFWVLKIKKECEGPEMSPCTNHVAEHEHQKVVEIFSSTLTALKKRLRKN